MGGGGTGIACLFELPELEHGQADDASGGAVNYLFLVSPECCAWLRVAERRGTELSCVASWLHRLSSRSLRVRVPCRPMLDRCGMTYRYHYRTYELDDVPRDARLALAAVRLRKRRRWRKTHRCPSTLAATRSTHVAPGNATAATVTFTRAAQAE